MKKILLPDNILYHYTTSKTTYFHTLNITRLCVMKYKQTQKNKTKHPKLKHIPTQHSTNNHHKNTQHTTTQIIHSHPKNMYLSCVNIHTHIHKHVYDIMFVKQKIAQKI